MQKMSWPYIVYLIILNFLLSSFSLNKNLEVVHVLTPIHSLDSLPVVAERFTDFCYTQKGSSNVTEVKMLRWMNGKTIKDTIKKEISL